MLGEICFNAFKAISQTHNYPPDFPNVQAATGVISDLIRSERTFKVAAEAEGRLLGSNFLYEGNSIAGVGPITVDAQAQNSGVGRTLMEAAIRRADERGFPGIRLVQAGYHMRSLSLYLNLGFEVREHLSCLQGPKIGKTPEGLVVRAATLADLADCNALCFQVHGHDRAGELDEEISQGGASVAERAGRISGYASALAFFGHAIGETNDDLKALIGSAQSFAGAGILVPTRNGELMRWCLGEGLRIVQAMTLMTRGLYNEPQGGWMPSVLY